MSRSDLKTVKLVLTLLFVTLSSHAFSATADLTPRTKPVFKADNLDQEALQRAIREAQTTAPVQKSTVPEEGEFDSGLPRDFDRQATRAAAERLEAEVFQSFQQRQKQGNENDKSQWTTVGGDDVVIMTADDISFMDGFDMDITENGDIYVVVQVKHAVYGSQLQVWRSLDGGSTWNQWGLRNDVDPDNYYSRPSIHVAEGTVDRLFLAYEYHNPTATGVYINVAYSDIDGDEAVWGVSVGMYAIDTHFYRPDITSDHVNFANYRVYLVSEEDDGSATDIWFRASANFGASWEPTVEIGNLLAIGDYADPKVSYGIGGKVHVVWYRDVEAEDGRDDAIRYCRGSYRGANGISDWNTVIHITGTFDGFRSRYPSVTGNPNNTDVLISYRKLPTEGGVLNQIVRLSSDSGLTWFGGDFGTSPNTYYSGLVALPGLEGYRMWGSTYGSKGYGYTGASAVDPLDWSDAEIFADYYHEYLGNHVIHASVCDYDQTRGNRLGTVFSVINWEDEGTDTLYFDAEWRADPGYPNLAANFPVPLTAAPVTPPALADIDGDGRTAEIVFATDDNLVHAIDRFGLELPGFPVDAGYSIADESLAVGDLDGDETNEIVVGTTNGHVYCWDNQGNLKNGWPRMFNTRMPAYVSIGTVSRLSKRDVVACSADEIHLLRVDGSEHNFAPYPIINPQVMHSAAAIGDIDLDGREELVIAAGDKVRVYNHDTSSGMIRTLAGTDLRNSPTLGNVDEADPELEIVVPTDDGKVWVFQHIGSTMTGWPYDTGVASTVNEVALSSIGPSSNDLAFTQVLPQVYMRSADGSGMPGWPQTPNPNWYLPGSPIVDELGPLVGNVAIGSRSSEGTVYGTDGSVMAGWPRDLGDKVQVSPASGDVNADGMTDLVYLTDSELVVLDLNYALTDDETRRWPMYGHDAQRTGCSDCAVDLVSAAQNQPGTSQVSFGIASANPSSGPTMFRYAIPNNAAVKIEIIDLRGRRVSTLVQQEQGQGNYMVTWDGNNRFSQRVAQGMYLARLRVDGPGVHVDKTQKVIITR